MSYTFDLINKPWIPCSQPGGGVVELGLRESLARAHRLAAIQDENPLATAALHRLLLAILHRAFGPARRSDWAALWQAGAWDMARLDAYFDQWRDRFDLFHPDHPFYQAVDPRVKQKSITNLVFDMASGANAVWFDHHTETDGASLSPSQAARALLAAQSFGLGGLSGLEQKFTDAPWGRGVIFFVEGNSLFETLALNLIRYNEDTLFRASSKDLPAWEMHDPFQPERRVPLGYLDYLTWHNRRICLIPESSGSEGYVRQVTIGPGLRLEEGIQDPFKHYRIDKQRGPLVLRFLENRALWRDSAALMQMKRPEEVRPPENFAWVASLVSEDGVLDQTQAYRWMALGMANDKAKVEFFREEHMPLPLAYFSDPNKVEKMSIALEWAENVRSQLWGAVNRLASLFIAPESDLESGRTPDKKDIASLIEHWNVERRYWSGLEIPFYTLVETLPAQPEAALEVWRAALQRAAWSAFEQTENQAGLGPKALKAAVRAKEQLAAGLKKILQPADHLVMEA